MAYRAVGRDLNPRGGNSDVLPGHQTGAMMVGTGHEHLLSSSPSWREYDREFSKLLDDPSGSFKGLTQLAAAGADHPGRARGLAASEPADEAFPRTTSAPPLLRQAFGAANEHFGARGHTLGNGHDARTQHSTVEYHHQVHAGNGFGDGGQRHVGFDLGAYCQQNGGGFCGSDSPRHEARLFAQPLSVLGESSSTGSALHELDSHSDDFQMGAAGNGGGEGWPQGLTATELMLHRSRSASPGLSVSAAHMVDGGGGGGGGRRPASRAALGFDSGGAAARQYEHAHLTMLEAQASYLASGNNGWGADAGVTTTNGATSGTSPMNGAHPLPLPLPPPPAASCTAGVLAAPVMPQLMASMHAMMMAPGLQQQQHQQQLQQTAMFHQQQAMMAAAAGLPYPPGWMPPGAHALATQQAMLTAQMAAHAAHAAQAAAMSQAGGAAEASSMMASEVFQAAYAAALYAQQSRAAMLYGTMPQHGQHPQAALMSALLGGAPGMMPGLPGMPMFPMPQQQQQQQQPADAGGGRGEERERGERARGEGGGRDRRDERRDNGEKGERASRKGRERRSGRDRNGDDAERGGGGRREGGGRERGKERGKEKDKAHGGGGSGDPADCPGDHGELLDSDGLVRFTSLTEVTGQVAALARDQHGCRFLQRKFDEGGAAAVTLVFDEVLDQVVDLMVDPFGNYLVQKLLDICHDHQRLRILQAVAQRGDQPSVPKTDEGGDEGTREQQQQGEAAEGTRGGTGLPKVIHVALNTHGTRAVQKLVETLRSPEQVALAIEALAPGVVTLIKDLNGNHVVQRCLQRLSAADAQFIYDAAGAHCVEIATHRHGCCVLQRCVDHATGPQRERLVDEVATNALALSQDPFGNYVVQYVLELGLTAPSAKVMHRLRGECAPLSLQKFSSNVIEKCLKLGGPALDEEKRNIVLEVTASPLLARLLQDPFGNYVVQSCLSVVKGPAHAALVEKIRPHLAAIKSSPYGKRILARSHLFAQRPRSLPEDLAAGQ